ncbi:MAG: protein-glutamate O-methyltransferase CheR, partial [Candidatus Riflebacteria bacterium]|nr:protein-glutamate O-methyltransferase CheR [Candidatus Riflebacteria bacterium]
MRPVEEWLAREIGLDVLSVGRQALAAAIARRMDHCSLRDPSAYVRLLTGSREERVALIDAVVVPETWFFRDRGPFEHLVRHVTQVWLPAHRSGSLLILSVPCSTGEEPYSIAMALLDAGLRPGSFRIEASDISVASLQRAEAAIYGPTSFRGSDISFRDRHFVARDGSFELKPAVRSQVRFRPGNLLDPGFAAGSGPYDIVFCRNLIIYQTDDARKSILRTLYGLTAPRGLLFVGHAELTSIMTERWTAVRQPCAFALM